MDRLQLNLAHDVLTGLSRLPRSLPPRLLYDAAGSALFEEITRLPEYYLTRAESEIFAEHAEEIMESAPPTLVELGAGSARKTKLLLPPLLARHPRVTFIPVDVSPAALEHAAASVRSSFPSVQVEPLEGRYRIALQELSARPGNKMVMFIGSSIGNFDPPDALALLRDLRAGMNPGDRLLLGTDLRKSPEVLLAAYDDAAGVTARFNLNLLTRLNRELEANFDLRAFRHLALWNDEESRIEMHLESLRDQEVLIRRLELSLKIKRGERIHTENSYKFTEPQVEAMLEESGFTPVQRWNDSRHRFAESLAMAT
jgi:L-histidine N-alpha-methyltransferase